MIKWDVIKFKIINSNLILFLLFFLLILAVYWPSLNLGFFSDDYDMLSVVSKNSNIFYYFSHNIIGEQGGGSYGPIWNLLFIIQYKLFQLEPFFYHFVSILVHVLNAILVYLLAKNIVKEKIISLASGLIFLILQNHVSAIVWISVQPHLFATFFFLLALYFYTNYLNNKKEHFYIFFVISLFFSLFTKEISITFPAVLILLELFFKEENISWQSYLKFLLKRLFVPILLFIIYLVLRSYTTGQLAGYYASSGLNFDFKQMYRMFLELTSNMFVSFPGRRLMMEWLFNHSLTVVLFLALFIWFLVKIDKFSRKVSILFLVIYIIVSLPFLQLLLHPLNNSGERYTYLISAFFSILFMSILFYLVRGLKFGRHLFIVICALVVIYNIFLIYPKERYWIQSGEVVKGIISSSREIDWQNKYVIFVGLPDNLEGGEVFRNSIKEAILMETNKKIEGIRIPIYTGLNGKTYNLDYFDLRVLKNGSFEINSILENSYSFTGFKDWRDETGDYHMLNYRKPELGDIVRINLNTSKMGDLKKQGKQVVIVYYNNLRLKEFFVE